MKIIGGIVSYEDGVKTTEGDQFSPTRKVRVELNFSLDEHGDDADASVAAVLDKAQNFVNGKLGVTKATAAAKTATRKTSKEGPTVAETQEANTAKALASSQVTAKVLSDKQKLEEAALAAASGKKSDPAAIVDETPAAVVEDALADLEGPGAEAEKPVTDADLNAAVKAKNGEIKDPVRIRELAAEYNGGPGHTLAEIPQEKRHDFLKRLNAFKAAA